MKKRASVGTVKMQQNAGRLTRRAPKSHLLDPIRVAQARHASCCAVLVEHRSMADLYAVMTGGCHEESSMNHHTVT